MNTATEIGRRIASARKDKGMSQEELADAVGVRAGIVSRWENGHNLPKITTLERVAQSLDRDIAYFTAGLTAPAPNGASDITEAMGRMEREVSELRVLLEEALSRR